MGFEKPSAEKCTVRPYSIKPFVNCWHGKISSFF